MAEGNGGAAALAGTAEGRTVARTQRAAGSTWTVYEQAHGVTVTSSDDEPVAEDVTVLIQLATNVKARTGSDACWVVAEGPLRERAESDTPPELCSSRNGTGAGLTEARPYALEKVTRRKAST